MKKCSQGQFKWSVSFKGVTGTLERFKTLRNQNSQHLRIISTTNDFISAICDFLTHINDDLLENMRRKEAERYRKEMQRICFAF